MIGRMIRALLFLLVTQYSYSPVGKTDPFRPLLPRPTKDLGKPKPLQRWDLSQLHLVAVVTGTASPYAMVEDPKGKGHVVRRGDLIGKNWGRVVGISPRTITIREETYDYLGRKIVNTQSMVIPKLPVAGDEDEDDTVNDG